MKILSTSLLAIAASALVSFPGIAQPLSGGHPGQGPRGNPLAGVEFAAVDADADGGITVEEWRSFLTARQEARMAEMLGARADALLAAGDADGDGALNRDELIAGFRSMAETRQNDRREARAEQERRPRPGREGGHAAGRDGHGPRGEHHSRGPRFGGAGRDGRDMAVRTFQRMDTDADGRVSEAEFAAALERFEARVARHGAGEQPRPAE